MSNRIEITPRLGADITDLKKLCQGIARWTAWAEAHDFVWPVKITLSGGPPMSTATLAETVRAFIPTTLAEQIRVETDTAEMSDEAGGCPAEMKPDAIGA